MIYFLFQEWGPRHKWGGWPASPPHSAWAQLPHIHLSWGCLVGLGEAPAAWPEAKQGQPAHTHTTTALLTAARPPHALTHTGRLFPTQPRRQEVTMPVA